MIKFWLDDERPCPSGYIGCMYVDELIQLVQHYESLGENDFLFDLDNDLGDDAADHGGDGRNFVAWLVETWRNTKNYKIAVHSMNPVAKQAMLDSYKYDWI